MDNNPFTVFFDTGCSDFVSRHNAVRKIEGRCHQEVIGPVELGGVGDCKEVSPHGIYEVKLPMHNGKNAVFFGICLDAITTKFPLYPLQDEVQRDIHDAYALAGCDVTKLPSLPKFAGGGGGGGELILWLVQNICITIQLKYSPFHLD